MRIFAVLLILCVWDTSRVVCEDNFLTVLLQEVGDAFPSSQDESTSSNVSFSLLQSTGLIESLEKSRTKAIEKRLDSLIWRKIDLETKLREAINFGSAQSIFNLMRERVRLVKELHDAREELIGIKLEILDRKRQVVKNIVESEDPISFDLFMQTLSLIYGGDLATRVADLEREAVQMFEKPFLRPVITISTPGGLPGNCTVVTAIYQNFKRQNTPVLKDTEFTVVTTVTGFTADNLHLGVDFYATNYTDDNPESRNSEENDLDEELLFKREVIEIQLNLTQTRLQRELEDLRALMKQQKKNLDHRAPKASDEIEKLENKLARKRAAINYDKAGKQMKLIAKQLERQRKFLLEFDDIEREALVKLAHVTKKIHKKQKEILDEKLQKKKKHDKRKSKKTKKDKKHGKGKNSATSENSTSSEMEVTESPVPSFQPNATMGTNSTEATIVSEDVDSVESYTAESENRTSTETEVDENPVSPSRPNSTGIVNVTQPMNHSEEIQFVEDEVETSSPCNSSVGHSQVPLPTTDSLTIVNSTTSADCEENNRNQTEPLDNRTQTVRLDEDDRIDAEGQETQTDFRSGGDRDEVLLPDETTEGEDFGIPTVSTPGQTTSMTDN